MMDNGGANVSHDELRGAVRKAILLNEHLLRRAWGILYLAMALSMFLSIFGTPIIDSLVPMGFANAIAMDMSASGCALVAILWAFKRVRHTAEITQIDGDRAWPKLLGYRFLVPLWIAINSVIILVILFARAEVSLVDLLIHLGLAAYVYYALKLSFSKKIPVEAILAVGSLLLGSVASISLLSVTSDATPYAIIWIATLVTWIVSGIFARTRPVPEFEEERTGLE